MKLLSTWLAASVLLLALPAQAGAVYRCAKPSGAIYYSDKGCPPTDKPADGSGLKGGNVSVVGGKGGAPSAPSSGGVGNGAAKSQYIRRAESGAARAEQAPVK